MKQLCIGMMMLVCIVFLSLSVQAESIGYVEKVDPPGTLQLRRNGNVLEIAPYSKTKLFAGDILDVAPGKCEEGEICTIFIKLCEQIQISVERFLCPFELPPDYSCESSSRLEYVIHWFSEKLGIQHKRHWKIIKLGGPMGGSDLPLSLPLLAESNARLTAGERTFSLFWHGGKKPYQVRVHQEGSETPLLEQQNLQEKRLQQAQVELSEGTYRVEVDDSTGDRVSGTFQVIPVSTLPPLPPEFGDLSRQSALAPELKDTLFALWLIEEHEDWEFEAYQLAAPLAEDYYPALLVQEQVEWQ